MLCLEIIRILLLITGVPYTLATLTSGGERRGGEGKAWHTLHVHVLL